jgi:hypothetical protein
MAEIFCTEADFHLRFIKGFDCLFIAATFVSSAFSLAVFVTFFLSWEADFHGGLSVSDIFDGFRELAAD